MDIDLCEEKFLFKVQGREGLDNESYFIFLFNHNGPFGGGGGLYIYNNMII